MKLSSNDVYLGKRFKRLLLGGLTISCVTVWVALQTHALQDDEYTEETRFFQAFSVAPKDGASTDGTLSYGLRREDFSRIAEIPTLEYCLPWRHMEVEVASEGKQRSMVMSGVTAEWGAARGIEIERGRFLTEVDTRSNRNTVVISQRAVDDFFSLEDPIGRTLMLGEELFVIVGVFATDDENRDAIEDSQPAVHQLSRDVDVFLPITTMRRRFGDQIVKRTEGTFSATSFELSGILLRVKEQENYMPTKEIVRKILLNDDDERRDFQIK